MKKTRIRNILSSLFSAVILVCVWSVPALAELKIDVTRGQVNPMPIAIPDFYSDIAVDQELGRNMVEVINDDLKR
ncbi:MAG: Tol-Pal system protein TolB, partial [Alphaproteobacteria bacterium]|nr:Tol-Pal system protein TolB [Alphaproteobacteria bacterium]